MSDFRSKVYEVVRAVPPGRVLTYGDVAALSGHPRAARGVGSAMAALDPEDGVPWWRVVGHGGRITTPRAFFTHRIQRELLEREGVEFTESGRVRMESYHGVEPAGPSLQPRGSGE